MRKQKTFLKKVQWLQSTLLISVILIMLSLVRISALLPGISEKADAQKIKAKQKVYEKEYIRGSILDRDGKAIVWSEEAGGPRLRNFGYSFSNLTGYYSKIYGTSGLESRYNAELTHSSSPSGEKRGADITLTIDQKLQDLAYEQIKDFTGSAVVLDKKTGEILALASSPSYDADSLEDNWEEISSKEGVFYSNAYQNPQVPGSVFKLVTSKAILEHHLKNKTVYDEGALKVNGQTIQNYDGTEYGPLKWEEGFVKSSNVYFMSMALKMGVDALDGAAKDFLIGEDIELDFTTLHSAWDLGTEEDNIVASTAFGQGNTLITPLQMAMITQSIANDGEMMRPWLVKSVANGRGKVREEGKEELLTRTMDRDTAKKIRHAMTEAGESYGLSQIGEDNDRIAAKTGTAERGDGTNNAWMVTFAPADDPRYVIVVNRLGTKKIGKSLAPVVETLYEYLLKE